MPATTATQTIDITARAHHRQTKLPQSVSGTLPHAFSTFTRIYRTLRQNLHIHPADVGQYTLA